MISVTESVLIIIDWLGCEELHFVLTLTDDEQEICMKSAGLFRIFNVKFEPQHNKTILLLQYNAN